MKLHRLAVATILATSAMAAHAEITVSPMVGYQWYDSNSGDVTNDPSEDGAQLRNGLTGSAALGYRVTPNVGLELRYGQGRTEQDGPGGEDGSLKVRNEMATVDAYYRFNADGALQPYVLVGGGLQRQTGDAGAGY